MSQISGNMTDCTSVSLGQPRRIHQSFALPTLCWGKPRATGGFPSQRPSDNESMPWQNHAFNKIVTHNARCSQIYKSLINNKIYCMSAIFTLCNYPRLPRETQGFLQCKLMCNRGFSSNLISYTRMSSGINFSDFSHSYPHMIDPFLVKYPVIHVNLADIDY